MTLTSEQIERIEATPFEDMVQQLTKPGAAILETMDSTGLTALLTALAQIALHTDRLDRLKKVVIYNKEDPSIPLPKGNQLPDHFTADKANLLHMLAGMVGEVGELAQGMLPYLISDDPLDMENIEEELGDFEFYAEGFRKGLGISRPETLRKNKHKLLGKRYASGAYSDEQAQARADKEEA